jgi:antitoxin FitA
MGQLIVRNIDESLVKALKLRAARKGRSAEAEHREILREALAPQRRTRTFKSLLQAIPPVGRDEDFERVPDRGRDESL